MKQRLTVAVAFILERDCANAFREVAEQVGVVRFSLLDQIIVIHSLLHCPDGPEMSGERTNLAVRI